MDKIELQKMIGQEKKNKTIWMFFVTKLLYAY